MATATELYALEDDDSFKNRCAAMMWRIADEVINDPFAGFGNDPALDPNDADDQAQAANREKLALASIVDPDRYGLYAVRFLAGDAGNNDTVAEIKRDNGDGTFNDTGLRNDLRKLYDFIAKVEG